MRRIALIITVVISLGTLTAQERPLPAFEPFAAEVKRRLATDEALQSGYVYNERRTEQRVDGGGRVTSEKVRVYEVFPGLPGEGRYLRLIEEDGKRTPAEKLAKDDAERRKRAEEYARRQADASRRQRDERELDKLRKEYSDAVDDIFRIFDIQMIGRQPIDGHTTIYATLTPRPDAKPLTDSGKIMRNFKARAWISGSDYELVRAEIEAIDTLSFGLGLLARVHKGTVATYERRKVNGEAWLPSEVTWTASARVMLLRRLRLRGVSQFSNYRRYTVDTSTTITPPR